MLAPPTPKVCTPGEIRKEYQAQVEKLEEERKVMKLQEEEASKKAILELQKEESKIIEEEQEILSKDYELAQKLRTEELKLSQKSSPAATSSPKGPLDLYLSSCSALQRTKHSTPCVIFPNTQKKNNRMLFPKIFDTPDASPIIDPDNRLSKYSDGNKLSEDKENGYDSEEFDLPESSIPEPTTPKTVPNEEETKLVRDESFVRLYLSDDSICKSDFNGFDKLKKQTNDDNPFMNDSISSQESLNFSGFPESPTFQRKKSPVKQKSPDLNPSDFKSITEDEDIELSAMIQEQRAIEAKIEQEKKDRLLAMQLEKEFKSVNRKKGSADEYNLRSPIQQKNKSTSSKSMNQTTPKRRLSGMRQTTLMESLTKRRKF